MMKPTSLFSKYIEVFELTAITYLTPLQAEILALTAWLLNQMENYTISCPKTWFKSKTLQLELNNYQVRYKNIK